MPTTVRYILITALRDRLFAGLCAALLVATGISLLLGSTAFLESWQMTVVLASGAARLILMSGLMVFACFHIHQMFDNKEIEVMLSRPLSRPCLLFQYWLGFTAVGLLLSLIVLAIIGLIGSYDLQGYAAWSLSLMLEVMLVVAMAVFASFTLRSAVLSVMGCMGLYLLSRMMAFFIMTSQSGLGTTGSWAPLGQVLEVISVMVPRLDMFTQSDWLVYGMPMLGGWWHVIVQAAIFTPLLLMAAMVDFRRREF
jgi:hypothetical protein